MASDKAAMALPSNNAIDAERPISPGPSMLRKRGSQRAFTYNEPPMNTLRRRSSFFSDTLSETHRSFRSSTDDLLLPRVKNVTSSETDNDNAETTHWHSLPLGLALLPAIAGIFFKDGSAIITDITLLGIAAIFLNWALRLPWEWYRSAQATIISDIDEPISFQPIVEDDENERSDAEDEPIGKDAADRSDPQDAEHAKERLDASKELRIHEMSALLACFVSPVLGAWLLHAIREQLSRPSEGLVSNYNLSIFLLVAELRPLSHLMKMIQRRTLFLQRRVNATAMKSKPVGDEHEISELHSRLEELEAHIADKIASQSPEAATILESSEALISKVAAQSNAEVRRSIQPELDALNRAMRRYEKRMTISAIQVEARLQDVETRLKDVVVLAAAAQRNIDTRSRHFLMTLMNWMSAMVVIPVQFMMEVLKIPGKGVSFVMSWMQRALRIGKVRSDRDQKNVRLVNKQGTSRPRPMLKKVKGAA